VVLSARSREIGSWGGGEGGGEIASLGGRPDSFEEWEEWVDRKENE
jgi:hypothetical protein